MLSDKIMVVDDDPRVIKSVKLAINEYEVIGFQNGEEAIAYLKKPRDVDLVLLDIFMRDLDGMTVLSAIKKINQNIAVIMMTAYGSMDLAIQALRYRADDFIEKPFDVTELRDKIKVLLKGKSYSNRFANENDERVERIKKFVERNYSNVSLENVADEMCLSIKYVSRMFKKKNKRSFRDYKLEVKMDKAKSMLKDSAYSVSQIAESLGYQNPESFMRTFKKMTKQTPTQYRKKHTVHKKKTSKPC